MTVDELLATAPTAVGTTDEMLVIDPDTRQINLPGVELVFGVESDAQAERKYFYCPRYVGNGLDLASCFIRVNYRNANGTVDAYLVDDMAVTGDGKAITFSWALHRNVTLYKGQVQFVVCCNRPGSPAAEWNTTVTSGIVLAGLEPDSAAVEAATSDAITALLATVDAQVANVTAEGAAQVRVVQTASETAKTAAVAEIEAKGASTLATIPEDYTAVQNAVRGAANAIRGKVSGEVIRVDDVSPMEHYPAVRVSGKNLFNGELVAGFYDGANFVIAGSDIYRSLKVFLRKGVYTFSASQEVMVLRTVIDGVHAITSIFGDSLTFTVENDGYVGISVRREPSAAWDDSIMLQIEEGEVATEYTPYIDPTTVTVTRCGKNILPYPFTDTTVTRKGVTFTDNKDGTITISGTAEATTSFVLFNGEMPVSGKYTFSGLNGGGGSTYYIQPVCSDKAYPGLTDGSKTYEWGNVSLKRLQITVVAGTTFANTKVALMLEIGDTASTYEPYTAETQIPSAEGMVSGLSAVAPTMTLMTDTPGVNIECEYSRDTNKVVNEILEMITTLTGVKE